MSSFVSCVIRSASRRVAWLRWPALTDIALIFAFSLALRLYGLGAKPFWIDEVVTRARSALPARQLVTDSLGHHHLPTYFLLLSPFSPGADAWLLRLPSAIGGAMAAALAVLVGQQLARRAGNRRMAGLMSGLMLAAAPVMVQYGQDARPYALELACLMLSLWGLVTLASDGEAAGGRWPDGSAAWSAFLLGLLGALALIGNAIPFLLVANLSTWPIARQLAGPARRRFLLRWVAGQACVLLAVGPLYLAMGHSVDDRYMAAFNWIPPLSALRAWRVGANVYLLRAANIDSLQLVPGGLPALGFVVLLLGAAGLVALRDQPAIRTTMLLTILMLPVLLVLSAPSHPLWLPRYLLWSGAAVLVLAGVGAAWLMQRWRVAGFAAAAVLLLFNLLPLYRAETAPRWDLAAATLAPALATGADLYMDDHGIPTMLRAYLPGGDAALPKSRVLYQIGTAEDWLRKGNPVIAVHGPTGQELVSSLSAFRAGLSQLGNPAEQISIGQEIVLIRFNPLSDDESPRAGSDARSSP